MPPDQKRGLGRPRKSEYVSRVSSRKGGDPTQKKIQLQEITTKTSQNFGAMEAMKNLKIKREK